MTTLTMDPVRVGDVSSTIVMALLCIIPNQNLRKKIAELMNTSKDVILLLEWWKR